MTAEDRPPAGARGRSGAVWVAFAVALLAWTAFWTAGGIANRPEERANPWHHYEYLAEGFVQGHTYLSVEPARELMALPDPYLPEANRPWRLWDASLYRGKYYLYYGPAPAVVLMVPWRLITGRPMPQWAAVAAFAVVGLGALAVLLREVRARYFPGLTGPALAGIVVVTYHASWLPVVLRRPAFWELPIVAALAFVWLALLCLWRFAVTGGRARWAAGAGLAVACLIGSRVTYLFGSGLLVLAMFVLQRNLGGAAGRPWRFLRGPAAVCAGLVCAGGLALLAYNHARFGRILEFGQSYQLWGADERNVRHFSLLYVPFNVGIYFLSFPDFGPYFPFVNAVWPEGQPEGYISVEEMHGILFALPVVFAGAAAIGWVLARRREQETRPLLFVVAAAAGFSACATVILCCWAGATSRYMAEMLSGATVLTGIGLMVVYSRGRPFHRHLATAAAIWTVGYAWLASAGFRDFMRHTHPRTYGTLAHALNYPSYWIAKRDGVVFGPADLVIRVPAVRFDDPVVLVATGRPSRINTLTMEQVDSGHVVLKLAEDDLSLVASPVLPVRDGVIRVRLEAPWLYPPPEHPFWDGFTDPRIRAALQTRFAVTTPEGLTEARYSTYFFDSGRFTPFLRSAALAGGRTPWVESFESIPVDGLRTPPSR